MTKLEKVKMVERLVADYKEMDAISDQIGKLMGTRIDSPALNPFWAAFDGYVKAVGLATGDTDAEWIGWFIWENRCGEKGMEAGYDDKLRKITTVKQLVSLIEQGLSRQEFK